MTSINMAIWTVWKSLFVMVLSSDSGILGKTKIVISYQYYISPLLKLMGYKQLITVLFKNYNNNDKKDSCTVTLYGSTMQSRCTIYVEVSG